MPCTVLHAYLGGAPRRWGLHLRLLLSVACLLGLPGIAKAQNESVDSAKTRRAVKLALPFLEYEGVNWMKEKACASCHHVPFLLWSHNEARSHGIAVDEKKLIEWTEWTRTFSKTRRAWFRFTNDFGHSFPAAVAARLKPLSDKPFTTEKELAAELANVLTPAELNQYRSTLVEQAARPTEAMNDGGGLDTLSQLLLGRAPGINIGNDLSFMAEMQDLMVRWQRHDGTWKAAGQLPLQDRTEAETDGATTMWATLALATIDGRTAAANQAIRRAANFGRTFQPGRSNESLIVALLVERMFGQTDRAAALLKEILHRQNEDGGWAWRNGSESDAFATGQALYGLNRAQLTGTSVAIQRGRDYLIQSQTDDGSWSVPGSAISRSTNVARLKKVAPIYRYWGTAWAAIGLAHTLPETTVAQAAQKPLEQ